MCLDRCPRISIPTSRITTIASGRTVSGHVPALSTSKYSPASCRSSPSAIWLSAELPVQRISTLFFSRALFWGHKSLSIKRPVKDTVSSNPPTHTPEQLLGIEEPELHVFSSPLHCFAFWTATRADRKSALDISLNGAPGTLNKCLLAAAFSFPRSSNFVTNLNGSFVVDQFEYNPLVVFLSDNPGASP